MTDDLAARVAPPPIAEIAASLERSSAARERAQGERARLAAAGLTHPDQARGEILAGAADAYLTQGMTFGSTPLNMPPLDSRIVFAHVPLDPGAAYHPQNTLAIAQEGQYKNSFMWPLLVHLTTTDHPDATPDTSQNVAMYSILHNRGGVWGAGFHADAWHEGHDTTIIFNGEAYRQSALGVVIGVNVQSDTDLTNDVGFLMSGKWRRGVVRTTAGELLGVGDTPIVSVDTSGDTHLGEHGNVYAGTIRQGPGDILQTFTSDGRLLRTLYADPYGSHIIGTANNIVTRSNGSVEINGPTTITGDVHINGHLFVNGVKIA